MMKLHKLATCLAFIMSLGCMTSPLKAQGRDYGVYVVDPPITNQAILPGRPLPAVCKTEKTLKVLACRGEYEPASFVVLTKEPLESVRIEMDVLSGPAGTLAKDVVDVRIAKNWSRSCPLLPARSVVLVKDDSLLMTVPNPTPGCPGQTKIVVPHGLRDAKELLPVHIDDLKQFWLTVHVPRDAQPGLYSASLRIIPTNAPSTELTLQLEVHPFDLLPPMTEYSIYYPVTVVPEGGEDWRTGRWINTAWITPKQYLLELKNMLAHGLSNPNIYEGVTRRDDGTLDFSKLEEVLALREKAGMGPGLPLYAMNGVAEPRSRRLSEQEKKERVGDVRKVMAWGRKRGYPDIYWAAMDEAWGTRLSNERDSFQAIHDGGGKVFVACNYSFYDLIGDLLDRPVLIANTTKRAGALAEQLSLDHPNMIPLADKAKRARVQAQLEEQYESSLSFAHMRTLEKRQIIDGTHRRGHRIFTYMFPQAGVPMPEVHRRHYGLGLWQMGFDGCMNWAYAHIKGSVTNPGQYWSRVIRAEEGVLDKLEWEGFREGVDDARYLNTLLDALSKASVAYGRDPLVGQTWTWLTGLDAATDDLNMIRTEMARRITALQAKEKDFDKPKKTHPDLSRLAQALGRAAGPFGKEPLLARTWTWLVRLEADRADPDVIRTGTDRRIRALKDLGEHRKPLWENLADSALSVSSRAPANEMWDLEFTGDGDPTTVGFKSKNLNSTTFGFDTPRGFLKANGNPGGRFYKSVSTNTRASGWTVEWAFKAQNLDQLPSLLEIVAFNDDTSLLGVCVTVDGIELKDNIKADARAVSMDLEAYHVYRLVKKPGSRSVELYIDNNPKPALRIIPSVAPASLRNNLESVSWGNSLFQARWDFFRYHKGATIPTAAPVQKTQQR